MIKGRHLTWLRNHGASLTDNEHLGLSSLCLMPSIETKSNFSEIDKINLISRFDIIQPKKFSTLLDEDNYFRSQQSTCIPRVMITF